MKCCAVGLNVRSLSVTTTTYLGGLGTSTGSALKRTSLAFNRIIDWEYTLRNRFATRMSFSRGEWDDTVSCGTAQD
jgi:hypothetical protein